MTFRTSGASLIGKSFAAAVLLATSSVGMAAGTDSAVYFGVGMSHADSAVNASNVRAINGFSADSSLDDEGFGFNLFVGYQLDDHLSLEVGYADLGQIQLDDNALVQELYSIEALYFDAALQKGISQNVDVFIKTGIAAWALTDDARDIADGIGMRYGAGMDINLYGNTDRVMRVSWDRYEYDGIYLDSSDVLSVSLIFGF